MNLCISNHVYDLVSFYELEEKYQEKAKKEFNWVDDIENSFGFFVYKNKVYNLGSFMRYNDFLTDEKTGKKFNAHGIYGWSYFNGIALEFVNHEQAVKIAYYY